MEIIHVKGIFGLAECKKTNERERKKVLKMWEGLRYDKIVRMIYVRPDTNQ